MVIWLIVCVALGDHSGLPMFGGWAVLLSLAWWRGRVLKDRRG